MGGDNEDSVQPDSVAMEEPRRESYHGFESLLKREAQLDVAIGKIPQLEAIACELFPGRVAIAIEEDPEIDDKRYVVVQVEATEPIEEVATRRKQWYNRTHQLLGPECELVQLAVLII
jgi:hypothetical protein